MEKNITENFRVAASLKHTHTQTKAKSYFYGYLRSYKILNNENWFTIVSLGGELEKCLSIKISEMYF